jgi:hypothetical protein
MNNYVDEETIQEYLNEWGSIEVAINILEDRMNTIDTILRHEHNFAVGKDRLPNGNG